MYDPHYTITNELLNVLAQIDPIRLQVDMARILPTREAEMRHRATVEATHSSTSIEGNPLNLHQVENVLAQKTLLTRHQYYVTEVKNYKKALDLIDQREKSKNPLTEKDILAIHKTLTKGLLDSGRSGVWRKNPVYIENQLGEKLYDAVKASQVSTEIANLLSWINEKSYGIHPVIAAAIVHIQFVSIHPFADGNGRTARILTMLYLGLRDYDFRKALVLDSYYSSDKASYYKALHGVQGSTYAKAERADLTPWIQYFAEGFLVSANVLRAEITLLSSIFPDSAYRKISQSEMDILSYANQFGSITISEAEDILPNISRRTIQRMLRKLVNEGMLRSEGATNGVKYISQETF